MLPHRPETTMPSGFRYSLAEHGPKTPEPQSQQENIRSRSPPKQIRQPAKSKFRRRNVLQYQFDAPAENYLAALASDTSVPDIEVPHMLYGELAQDPIIHSNEDDNCLAPQARYSPPKTPVPQIMDDVDTCDRRPDWSMSAVSTPEGAPSSAMSDASDHSDDSYFSSIRTTRPLEDDLCLSPDAEYPDLFMFPPKSNRSSMHEGVATTKPMSSALWSRDTSSHLWQTYQLYLQDPTVTPFRIGVSAVPPEGVIIRVAREARRTFKGPLGRRMSKAFPAYNPAVGISSGSKSGHVTPIDENASLDLAVWPYTSAATRQHLRELCKRDAAYTSTAPNQSNSSSSSKTHFRAHSTGHTGRVIAPFETRDFALSLTTDTAESMRRDGPLAQLTASEPQKPRPFSFDGHINAKDKLGSGYQQADIQSRRLGSPFLSRTFGPSTSTKMSVYNDEEPDTPAVLAKTKLKSPLHFGESAPLNSTQKRRAHDILEEGSTPSGSILRPSILDDQLFGGPFNNPLKSNRRARGFSLGDEVLRNQLPSSVSMPQMETASHRMSAGPLTSSASGLLPSVSFGSPLQAVDRHTFPRRLFQAQILDPNQKIRKRPHHTMHHPRRSIESFSFENGSSLQNRLRLSERGMADKSKSDLLDERLAAISKRVEEVEKQRIREHHDPMEE